MRPSMNQVTVARSGPGNTVACAVLRPRVIRHNTVGSESSGSIGTASVLPGPYNETVPSAEPDTTALVCGCRVKTGRDFLGRTIGTIVERASGCTRDDHQPGHVVLMPGREHARPE